MTDDSKTFRRAEDHVVELLGQVLDEMVSEKVITEQTARRIEERLRKKIKEHSEDRTSANQSKIK